MDIFKFNNPTAPTRMEQGEIIQGLTSKMWIERYSEAGEFTLVAPAYESIRQKLSIGSFLSHVDTQEIMIVENHEINTNEDTSLPEITITGRGFETFLENRVVGSNIALPFNGVEPNKYILAHPAYLGAQIVGMINDHILPAYQIDSENGLPYVSVLTTIVGSGDYIPRTILVGLLYDRLLELLAIEDLGIKVIRPGPFSPLAPGSADTAIVIHKGVDRSTEVIFDNDLGEIESADYLWSNKKAKNAALVVGKWVKIEVEGFSLPGGTSGYRKRTMYVDGTDIDGHLDIAPAGLAYVAVVQLMQQKGLEALKLQNDISLTKTEISKRAGTNVYRRDYDVGDFVTVTGDYNDISVRRVSEYVEMEDENGQIGYPTLIMQESA